MRSGLRSVSDTSDNVESFVQSAMDVDIAMATSAISQGACQGEVFLSAGSLPFLRLFVVFRCFNVIFHPTQLAP